MTSDPTPACPTSIHEMTAAAEKLAQNFDFLRCDFYEVDGKPRFGEIIFYPGSGYDRFDPPELDEWLGLLWTKAREAQKPS